MNQKVGMGCLRIAYLVDAGKVAAAGVVPAAATGTGDRITTTTFQI